ncbi:MAG: hypothetical protein Q9P14_14175 [candidate division KSB1 bacterium]|nr:hypothetical protein [candidate division KSB1 bacterium]
MIEIGSVNGIGAIGFREYWARALCKMWRNGAAQPAAPPYCPLAGDPADANTVLSLLLWKPSPADPIARIVTASPASARLRDSLYARGSGSLHGLLDEHVDGVQWHEKEFGLFV